MALFKKKREESRREEEKYWKERAKREEEARRREEEYWEQARKKLSLFSRKEKPEKPTIIIQPPQTTYIKKRKGPSFFSLLLIGVIIIAIFIFFENCFGIIGICDVWASELKTSAEPAATWSKSKIVEVIYYLENPQEIEEKFTWTDASSKSVEKEEKGVIIKEFSSRSYRENQPILIKTNIETKNLDNDIELAISCEMEDYKGKAITRLVQQDSEDSEVKIFVPKDFDAIIPVMCIFPDGVKIEDEKQFISKKVNLNVLYDYQTKSTLSLYTLDENLQRTIEDPFAYYGEKQTLINAGLWDNGLVKSRQEFGGPIELAIGVEKQPLSVGPSGLVVRLKNHFEIWNGNLDEIENLRLRLPVGVEINQMYCEDFQGRDLKPEVIYEVNQNKCTTNDLINPASEKYEECRSLSLNKNDLKFFCEIILNDLPETPMSFLPLEAYLDYKYKTKKETNVRIIKLPKIKEIETNISD